MVMSPAIKKRILDDLQKKNHPLLYAKNFGIAPKLLGNIKFIIVFANDKTSSPWTNESMKQYMANFESAMIHLQTSSPNGASTFSYQLETFVADFKEYDIGMMTNEAYNNTVALESDLTLLEKLSDFLEKKYISFSFPTASWNVLAVSLKLFHKCDGIGVVFALNRSSRAYALPTRPNVYHGSEYCVTFPKYEYAPQKPHIVIAHEILHLFGAADLYTPQNVADLAKIHYPQSIMDDGEMVDEITSYSIGWTDSLSEKAIDFLMKTL